MTNSEGARECITAKVTVLEHKAQSFESSDGPDLVEISIVEEFAGGMAGKSQVRALQVRNADGVASQVSLQRVWGSLAGRNGSYVLQGEGTVSGGKVRSSWFVVPQSGTGQLSRLRGEGGFEGEFGKGSTAWLEFWFEDENSMVARAECERPVPRRG